VTYEQSLAMVIGSPLAAHYVSATLNGEPV
jgi:hypothetical protein